MFRVGTPGTCTRRLSCATVGFEAVLDIAHFLGAVARLQAVGKDEPSTSPRRARAGRLGAAVLMDVSAGHQRRDHAASNATSRWRGAGLTKRPVISVSPTARSNIGLCRKSARRRGPSRRRRLGDGCVLLLRRRKVAAQELGVQAEQPPARHVERPPVGVEVPEVALAARRVDRALAVRRRILAVADIMVARQEAHRQVEPVMQGARRREVASFDAPSSAISPELSTRSGRSARSASPMRTKLSTKNGLSSLRWVSEIWAMRKVMSRA